MVWEPTSFAKNSWESKSKGQLHESESMRTQRREREQDKRVENEHEPRPLWAQALHFLPASANRLPGGETWDRFTNVLS